MTKVPEDLNALYETVCTSENPDAVTLIQLIERIARLEAQNKALLEALEGLLIRHCDGSEEKYWAEWDAARAALAQAKEPLCSTP